MVDGLAEWAMGIVSNPAHYPILGVTWILIELIDRLLRWVISSPRHNAVARVRLHQLCDIGKRGAAVFWCSIFVWVPLAQPDLCGAQIVDGCQTVMERLANGAVLGFLLSGGHFLTAAGYRRVRGQNKRRRIICASCRKKVTVSRLSDPCPECDASPHEVTRP